MPTAAWQQHRSMPRPPLWAEYQPMLQCLQSHALTVCGAMLWHA